MRWDEATFGWPEMQEIDGGGILRLRVKPAWWSPAVVVVVLVHWSGACAVAFGHQEAQADLSGVARFTVSGAALVRLREIVAGKLPA